MACFLEWICGIGYFGVFIRISSGDVIKLIKVGGGIVFVYVR